MYTAHGDIKEHSGKNNFSEVEHIILTYIHQIMVKVSSGIPWQVWGLGDLWSSYTWSWTNVVVHRDKTNVSHSPGQGGIHLSSNEFNNEMYKLLNLEDSLSL